MQHVIANPDIQETFARHVRFFTRFNFNGIFKIPCCFKLWLIHKQFLISALCESIDCLNDGHCEMKSGNTTCICAPTFQGNRCETCKYVTYRMKCATVASKTNYPSLHITFHDI